MAERDGATLEGDARELTGDDRLLPTWQKATPCVRPGWRVVHRGEEWGQAQIIPAQRKLGQLHPGGGQSYQVPCQPRTLTLLSKSLT